MLPLGESWASGFFSSSSVRAKKGILDLRNVAFDEETVIELKGEWSFYWDQFIFQDDLKFNTLEPTGYYKQPQSWTWHDHEPAFSTQGKGTYKLEILFPENIDEVYIRDFVLVQDFMASANGQILRQWQKNGSEISHLISIEEKPFHLPIDPLTHKTTLIIQIQNDDMTILSGFHRVPYIGSLPAITKKRELAILRDMFIFACMLIMGVYHLFIYAFRTTEKINLYFSIGLSVLAFLVLHNNEGLIKFLTLSDDYFVRSYCFLAYGTSFAFFVYTYTLYPNEYHKGFYKFQCYFYAALIVIVALTPFRIYQYSIFPFHAVTVISVCYIINVVIKAIRMNRQSAKIYLFAAVVVMIALFNDILYALGHTNTILLTPWAGLIFVMLQSLLLSKNYAAAFQTLEESEKKIRRLNLDLQEKEAARTRFFHNTSHELRTPLNGILGFLNLIKSGRYGSIEERVLKQIDKVEFLSKGLLNHINMILALAKAKRGEVMVNQSVIDLNHFFQKICALGEGLTMKYPNSEFKPIHSWSKDESPQVSGDQDRLEEIVRNLLGNAFKFHQDGQKNTVIFEISLDQDQFIKVIVKDRGIGIPKEFFNEIFDEFKQVESDANRRHEGSGIGLALVRENIKLLGGTITLKSEIDEGSCFIVSIPTQISERKEVDHPVMTLTTQQNDSTLRSHSYEAETQISQKSSVEIIQRGELIYVIDDNPINLEVIQEMLASVGYEVETFQLPQQAYERIQVRRPDIVLLDLMMPTMSGDELLKKIRQHGRFNDLPIILLTARASQDDRLFGLSIGADDYLAKPIVDHELLIRVRNMISRIKMTKERAAVSASLEAAKLVQTSLLPPKVSLEGLTIREYYQTAEAAGGDWYYYYYDETTHDFYAFITDVMGHGISAAIVTGTVSGIIRTLLHRRENKVPAQSLVDIMTIANHELIKMSSTKQGLSMTMAALAFNCQTGRAYYVNAGHTPLIVKQGEKISFLLEPSCPLGIKLDLQYRSQSFDISERFSVFLYTDGLIENEGRNGKLIKLKSITKMMKESDHVQEFYESLNQMTRSCWQNTILNDDVSFLMIEWNPNRPVSQTNRSA